MADATKPDILIFCNGAVDGGLKKMKEKANVHQASFGVPGDTSSLLHQLSRQVVEYVKNRGGIVIVGGFFSLTIRPSELNRWLRHSWGMPWRSGQYGRTTVLLQDSHVGLEASTRAHLVASYSSKALFLKNVSSSDSLYASPKGARSESIVFGPVPIEAQTVIAFGKCGQGWLGFTGDTHNVDGTAEALLAMMGLLA
ncbi:hypothetical protein F4782DRAFT_548794 [Xylaria castorea]|nr:hypothetical protein F4782DRAFT_548794 [Xylaria castorea]